MAVQYNSNYDLTHPFSNTNAAIHLSANTEDSFTVPGTNNEKYVALFEYPSDASVFVALNDTAAFPAAGNITFPSTSQFKPYKRYVKAGDDISLIADADTLCGVSLYQIV